MSSTNEELPPPKPRASPLDFRNTDLVSRLLAATPPYLYNMPLVPNSYFFSEMLRSFVQAKAENSGRTHSALHHRRSRKRSWAQTRTEYYQKDHSHLDKPEVPSPNWNTKPVQEKCFENRKVDRPLELTMEKSKMEVDVKGELESPLGAHRLENSTFPNLEKPQIPVSSAASHLPMYPNLPHQFSQDSHSSNMILPPPPPIWYPPLYPTPYGIDPLHFFIDLRVSGHIYDRKNGKEPSSSAGGPSSPTLNQTGALPTHCALPSQTHSQDNVSSDEKAPEPAPRDFFKHPRHSSAFSVPVPSVPKNVPMNLSSDRFADGPKASPKDTKVKFDVKSMGFDKGSCRTSVNYVMSNIGDIYKRLREEGLKAEEGRRDEGEEETEEQRQKRVKDLRALIGLELVVDYMNQAKPGQPAPQTASEESSTDLESAGSPAVEVVAIGDDLKDL